MSKPVVSFANAACPCGSGQPYGHCCQPLHEGAPAATAETLMRSRYSAYVLGLDGYLRRSWHPSTCPADFGLDKATQWLGLKVVRYEMLDETHALVEFVARYKLNGRAFRLHESSRFVCENGHWFYVDGVFPDGKGA